MRLLLKSQTAQLIRNGQLLAQNEDLDLKPVVKLFTPDSQMSWLLVSLDPDDTDHAFGLCDLGIGCPELGFVSLTELRSLRGLLGLPIERDMFFRAVCSVGGYAAQAMSRGYVLA